MYCNSLVRQHKDINPILFVTDYEHVAEKAGKMESEVKRLHKLIIDTSNQKLKVHQDKLDKINKEIDEHTSAITKAQVAIKSAQRYGRHQCVQF